jgi:hypothetical protein
VPNKSLRGNEAGAERLGSDLLAVFLNQSRFQLNLGFVE